MNNEKFCLRWNDFETNVSAGLRELREEKDFFDVTLACDDNQLQAHKVILSACSSFFRNILRRNPHQHPLVYLKGVKYSELQSILNFMYVGEVNVAQEDLNSFLSAAEELRVKGLTQNSPGEQSMKSNTYKEPAKPRSSPAILAPKQPKYREPTPAQQHQEIEEVVHVKSEPREVPPQVETQKNLPHPQHKQTEVFIPEGEPDVGTVALDQNYEEQEGYDYQYEAYEDAPAPSGHLGGLSGAADLESLIASKMMKNSEGDWQCKDCYKTSKVKTNIFEHIEAAHVESPGYQCEICYKIYRTRSSFRKHKNVNHKETIQQHY